MPSTESDAWAADCQQPGPAKLPQRLHKPSLSLCPSPAWRSKYIPFQASEHTAQTSATLAQDKSIAGIVEKEGLGVFKSDHSLQKPGF